MWVTRTFIWGMFSNQRGCQCNEQEDAQNSDTHHGNTVAAQ